MNISFSIEIAPENLESALKGDVEALEKRIVKELVELAPVEMRDLINEGAPSGRTYARPGRVHQASAKGQVPAIDSSALFYSLKGSGDTIEMIDYAARLDPFLGGELNRPFIEKGVDKALVKIAAKL